MNNASINYENITINMRNILIEQQSPSYGRGVIGGMLATGLLAAGINKANTTYQEKKIKDAAAEKAKIQAEVERVIKERESMKLKQLKDAAILKQQELEKLEKQKALLSNPLEIKSNVKSVLDNKRLPPEVSTADVQSKLIKALTSIGVATKEFISYVADQIIVHPKIALSLAGITALYTVWKRSQKNKIHY